MTKEKSLLFFFYFMWQHFALSFLFYSPRIALSWLSSFSLSGSFLATLSSFSFLCGFLFLCSCTHSLCVFLKVVIPCTLLPFAFLPSENPFSLSWFHALFSLSLLGGLLGQNHQIVCSIVYL